MLFRSLAFVASLVHRRITAQRNTPAQDADAAEIAGTPDV